MKTKLSDISLFRIIKYLAIVASVILAPAILLLIILITSIIETKLGLPQQMQLMLIFGTIINVVFLRYEKKRLFIATKKEIFFVRVLLFCFAFAIFFVFPVWGRYHACDFNLRVHGNWELIQLGDWLRWIVQEGIQWTLPAIFAYIIFFRFRMGKRCLANSLIFIFSYIVLAYSIVYPFIWMKIL